LLQRFAQDEYCSWDDDQCGTIWIPFTGARFVPSDAVLGMAVSVKPVAVTALNIT
jgi:hypothetical protein